MRVAKKLGPLRRRFHSQSTIGIVVSLARIEELHLLKGHKLQMSVIQSRYYGKGTNESV